MPQQTDMKSEEENRAFAQWRDSSIEQKEELLLKLVPLLQRHAYSVCWLKIPDRSSEFGWIANAAVWKAIQKADKFKGKSKFSTWFHKIVLNLCNDHLSEGRREEVPLEEMEGASEKFFSKMDLLGGLTEAEEKLLALKQEGLSTQEIADALGIRVGAAKVRWLRLKRKVQGGRTI